MKEQKLKRGNLVKVLVGHPLWSNQGGEIDLSPEDVGRFAIIDHSYAEKFGGTNVDSYSIIWPDTGCSEAWKRTNELEFIAEGGEYLFEEAKANRERLSKQNTDINYIAANLEGSLNSESILFLFDLIGYKTSFHTNGEYFVLVDDWEVLRPAFVYIKNAKTVEDAEAIFTNNDLNVSNVWNAFHA